MTVNGAKAYHRQQLEALAATSVGMVAALSMTSVDEAVGLVLAARDTGLPIVVSPTIETDGSLPDHTSLRDFVRSVDRATRCSEKGHGSIPETEKG